MSAIHFRPLCLEDEQEFYVMAEEFYHSPAVLRPIPPERHQVAFREIMTSDRYLSGYWFADEEKAAGFAVINRMMQHEMGGIVVWVEELYIRPAYRGQGLGSRFLMWLEQELQGKATAIRLETEPENEGARRLYTRLGYEPLDYMQMLKKL